MLELLSKFSVEQILVFLVLLAIAIKSIVEFVDWVKSRLNKHDDKTKKTVDYHRETKEWRKSVEGDIANFVGCLNEITSKVDLLMASDKDAIKAYITREHHYFCYQKGWIDDYSLDCLERRYQHYVDENGNSFIKQLMDEVRELPRQPKNDSEGDL